MRQIGQGGTFEAPRYSKRQVIEAGKSLACDIGAYADRSSAAEVFRIAHNWRASHALPMHHMHLELVAKSRSVKANSITAARLKRMRSIRKKLRETNYTLYQMQDIGGCRIIVDTIGQVRTLVDIYRSDRAKHIFRSENDYISIPKVGGYRCHHMVFRYCGVGEYEIYNRNSIGIELQLRTRLQHAWATAVEAVGMVRGEDLKGGKGCPHWLRLFTLMASEMAVEEDQPLVPSTPDARSDRRKELIHLDRVLNASRTLENYNQAIKFTEFQRVTVSRFFLIEYDNETMQVSVNPVSQYSALSQSYRAAERGKNANAVLVEVGRVADLKAAYPNYFLDVQMFTDRLMAVLTGNAKRRFNMGWWQDWVDRVRVQ